MVFYVGQKVVCVDAKPRKFKPKLIEGNIYTIVGFSKKSKDGTVFLHEVKAEHEDEGWGFYRDRFRPVVEKKTNISIFEAMLNVHPVKLDEQI
jgi:hypothetical protein